MASVLDKIAKKYGEMATRKLGEVKRETVDVIPTGSMAVDFAMDVGGFPRGRISEVYGWEGSFKTSLALTAVANAQKMGMNCMYIDVENELNPEYARLLGVDVDNITLSQPDSAEQALDIVDMVVRTDEFQIVVVDSVAALVPLAEVEGEMGDMKMGLQARLMSQAMRKIKAPIRQNNVCVIFINQLRQKIGVMYGNPDVTTGGNALKFYASMRIKMTAGAHIKDGTNVVGRVFKARVEKNKVGTPFREAEFSFYFNSGISRMAELIDIGSTIGVIDKRGAYFFFNGDRLGQGKDNASSYLETNKGVAETIERMAREQMKRATLPVVVEADDPDLQPEE